MSDIKIEALEAIKSDGYDLVEGDRVTVPEDVARRWCGAGWAESVNGEIPTGDRRVIRAVIDPHVANQTHKAKEVSNG